MAPVQPLPEGTVTFLFSDIEGSTLLLQQLGEQWKPVVEEHQRLLRAAFQAWDGHEIRTEGDAFFVVFRRATDAVAAAAAAQKALFAHSWPAGAEVRVRMGLHTGEPQLGGGDYVGLDVHRAARISAAGHGGQILLSQTTRDLVALELPEGASLRELGSHRLKDLPQPERSFQLVIPHLPAEFPPLRSQETRPHNLPAPSTPLLGREREVAAVRELLLGDTARLVTLAGPGGTGKTRLSLQIATELLSQFADGVLLVALASISDPGLVPSTIAQVLGVRERAGQPLWETVKEYLRERQLLLLLDNFEQIVDAAPLVAELLAAAPRLKVLVTSRTVLRVRGEYEFCVPPLALPDLAHLPPVEQLTDYAAVALFLQRAQAVKPDFGLSNQNARAIIQVCHRLDGLPLAIELAAARVKLLPPQALLPRLENRLKLLVGGARDLPERQQTLRGAIAWSHDLLDEAERALFRRLSVFVGGCTLEAAEAVCQVDDDLPLEVLEGAASLVDKSLVRQEEVGGEARLIMLETIREYAGECLASSVEAVTIRRQHAHYFLSLAEAAEPELHGREQMAWLDRLEREHDNLRAALEWCHAKEDAAEIGLRLARALWRFWNARGHLSEGRKRLRDILALPAARAPTVSRARALMAAGSLAYFQGDLSAAGALGAESLALSQQVNDEGNTALVLNQLGTVARSQGDLATARELYDKSLAVSRPARDQTNVALSLANLGIMAHLQNDEERATALLSESLALFREVGDQWLIASVLTLLGRDAQRHGEYSRAAALHEESLTIFRTLESQWGIALCLGSLAGLAGAQGQSGAPMQWQAAARLFGAEEALRETIHSPLWPAIRLDHERSLAAVRAALGEAAFAAAWAEGRSMSPDEAIEYALATTTGSRPTETGENDGGNVEVKRPD